MTQEEKELLLKDLSARLLYDVLCEDMEGKTRLLFGIIPTQHLIVTLDNATDGTNGLKFCTIDCVKPYLRPISSMTEEEIVELKWLNDKCDAMPTFEYVPVENYRIYDWLNRHHFDYRGLIEKGLALEAPEDMYKTV